MATFLCAYRQKLDDLAAEEAKIPSLQAELEDLRAAATGLCQDTDAKPFFEAHDRIRELSKQIAALKSGDRLGEIILEALPFIKALERDERMTCDAEARGSDPRPADASPSPKTMAALGIERFVTVSHKTSAGTIARGYAQGNLLPEQSTDAAEERRAMICSECDASLLVNTREAVLVCVECGRCQPHLEIAACNMTFSDRQAADVLTHFSYRCDVVGFLVFSWENFRIPEPKP